MIDQEIEVEISFSNVTNDIIGFAKNPRINPLPNIFLKNPISVFPYLLGIDFVLMFFLSAILALVGASEIEHKGEELFKNPLFFAAAAIILAPILEEAIFRLPIGPWLGEKFKLVFWLLTLAFAAVHLTNFANSFPIYLAPLLILPQFLLGIILGYVRVGWGYWFSVLFHALHNGILVSLAILGTGAGSS